MHKLQRLAGAPGDYLAQIIAGKNGPRGIRLTGMIPNLNARYAALEAAYTPMDISGVLPIAWTQGQKDDLLHCYESTARTLEELKRLITEAQVDGTRDVCPYCGIGAPDSLITTYRKQNSQTSVFTPTTWFPAVGPAME